MGINIRTCLLQIIVVIACVLVTQTTAGPLSFVDRVGSMIKNAPGQAMRAIRGVGQRNIDNPVGVTKFLTSRRRTGSSFSFPNRKRSNAVTTTNGGGTSSVQGKQQTGATVQGQQSSTSINTRSSGSGGGTISKMFGLATSKLGSLLSWAVSMAWALLTVMLALVTRLFPRTIEAIKQGQMRVRDRLVIEMQSGKPGMRSMWSLLDVRVWYESVKGVILSIIIGLLDAFIFALGNLLMFMVIFLLLVVFLMIQSQGSDLVTMAHSGTLLAQKTTNKVLGLSNTAADVTEVVLPIMNAQIYSSVQSAVLLAGVFVPQDAYLDAFSDTSGEEEEALDSQMAYDGELRGRRLQVQMDSDGKVQAWNLKKFIKPFGLYALRMSNVMVLTTMFSAVITAIVLQMMEPFLDVILYLLSMIVMKFVCLVGHGRILCAILEIVELSMFFVIRTIFFLFSFIFVLAGGSDIPLPDLPFSCGESDFGNQAEMLAPMCGGFLWEPEPIGASLSGLRQTRINLALAEETRKQEEARQKFNRFQSAPGSTYHGMAGMTGNGGIGGGGRRLQEMWDGMERGDWLYCTRSTHDGSFVETMRGRRLHVTHGKELGCPHARDVILNPLHERAMQFHRLNVKDTCLNVCLNGFHFSSCYEASGDYHPLLAMGGGGCDGGDMEANRTAVDAILHEMFPELTQQQRHELILSDPPPQPPPPPPPAAAAADDTDDDSSNTTATTTTGRRNLFGTLSRKILSKAEVVRHFEREYVGKYVVMDVECNVEPGKPNKGPHETFVDMMCIIGKYVQTQDWNKFLHSNGLDKDRLGYLNRPTEFSLKGIHQATGKWTGERGGRRLMEEDTGSGGIKVFQHATEFVKLTEGLRREDRLLRAAQAMKNDNFTRRVLTTVTEKPSFVHVYRHGIGKSLKALDRLLERSEVATGEDGTRRRRLVEEEEETVVTTSFQIISSCPLNYYLCANGRQCVPNDEIDECLPLEVTEETGVLAQANQYIQDATTYDLDIKGYVQENCYECWRNYDRRPETNPFQYNVDADLSNVKYCCGLIEPDLSRFDPVAETGISGFVAGICNSTSGGDNGTALASNCFCPWYFPTSLSNNVYVYGLFDIYVYNHIMNALIIVQTFTSVYITGPEGLLPYIGYVWSAWADFYCAGHCSPWFTDLFGTFGYETTTGRRLTCVFLHAGSFFYTVFLCFGLVFFIYLVKPTLTFLIEVFVVTLPRAQFRTRRRRGMVGTV